MQPASPHLVGVPDDWSHHHLVFSNPGTYEQAAKDPAALAKWLTIHYDARFILQQMKRHAEAAGGFSREMRTGGEGAVSPSGMVEPEDLAIGSLRQLPGEAIARLRPRPKPKSAPVHGLWSESMPEGSVQPNAYPAKWGASLTNADCSGDYVVYPTGAAGGTSEASIVAYNNLYSGCSGTVPSIYWAYDTAGGLISTSPIISKDGSQVAFVQVYTYSASLVLLKGAANSPVRSFTGTLSAANTYGSPGVTLSSGSFDPTMVGATISDATTPSAIPAGDTIFEYLDPSTALLATAPSTESSDQALVISATAFRPYSLTPVDNSTYLTCTAPCMTKLAFSGSPTPNDTFSSPFYDYADDVLYVGDDNGNLHKFTPVFSGPLAEVTTSPWPVLLNAGRSVTGTLSTTNTSSSPGVTLTSGTFTQADVGATISDSHGNEYLFYEEPISTVLSPRTADLVDHPYADVSEALTIYTRVTSPVYDTVSGNVFVGDTAGYFYAVGTGNMGTTAGSVTKSADLGDVIIDGPLVDAAAGVAYAFVTTNNDTSTPSNAVFQFPTTTSTTYPCPAGAFCTGGNGNNGANGIEVGAGGAGYYFYSGTFDNVYYQSSSAMSPSGNLYILGGTGTLGGGTLYRIPISSNSLPAQADVVSAVTGLTGAASPWPSPLTEFCNNGTSACSTNGTYTTSGTDYLFFSVNMGAVGTCTNSSGNGCVLSYNITTPSSPTLSGSLNSTNVGSPGCWAAGGIVIDNSDTGPGASQAYFISLNGNNAGGPWDNYVTSGECASGSSAFIQAVQASQEALK